MRLGVRPVVVIFGSLQGHGQGLNLVKIIFDALDRRLLVAGAVFPPHRAVTGSIGLEGGPVYGVIGQSTSPGSTNFSMTCVKIPLIPPDRKSTRLNSSHVSISYA